jgi:hypothetical protein
MQRIITFILLAISIVSCVRAPVAASTAVSYSETPTDVLQANLPKVSQTKLPTLPPINTATPKPTVTSTLVPPLTPTSFPTKTAKPIPLTQGGPWLTFECETSLISDFDGLNLQPLHQPALPEFEGWHWEKSSSHGRFFFYRTVVDNLFDIKPKGNNLDYQMWIVKYPYGDVVRKIPILSQAAKEKIETELQNADFGTLPVAFGIAREPTYLWSPNGRYLAFSAAIDDPQVRIYLYDTQEDTIRRITDENHDAVIWSWSPDSQWVVYREATEYYDDYMFSFRNVGVWAVSITGESKFLYEPVGSEVMDTWVSDSNFLVWRWVFEGPPSNLRLIDIQSGRGQNIYQGDFTQFAYDPDNRQAIALLRGDSFQEYPQPDGLYRINAGEEQLHQVIQGSFDFVEWIPELKLFSAGNYREVGVTDNLIFFDPTGQIILKFDVVEGYTDTSPNGQWIMIEQPKDKKLLTPNGVLIKEIGKNERFLHSPDGNWLLIGDAENLKLYDLEGDVIKDIGRSDCIRWFPDTSGFLSLVKDSETGRSKLYRYLKVDDNNWDSSLLSDDMPGCSSFGIVYP